MSERFMLSVRIGAEARIMFDRRYKDIVVPCPSCKETFPLLSPDVPFPAKLDLLFDRGVFYPVACCSFCDSNVPLLPAIIQPNGKALSDEDKEDDDDKDNEGVSGA